jgi:hypothetical protein
MGRQFQLETIPRFQWWVIVEVCSGLAQTKLDSTNFWVIECDVRFGSSRHFDGLPMTSGLPPEADIVTAGRHVSKVPTTDLFVAGFVGTK